MSDLRDKLRKIDAEVTDIIDDYRDMSEIYETHRSMRQLLHGSRRTTPSTGSARNVTAAFRSISTARMKLPPKK